MATDNLTVYAIPEHGEHDGHWRIDCTSCGPIVDDVPGEYRDQMVYAHLAFHGCHPLPLHTVN